MNLISYKENFLKNKTALNLVALAAIQGANALIPILFFPYLIFTLGATLFARLVALEAVALYVVTVSLYSFEVIGVQRLIEAKGRGGDEAARVYFEILYARISLFLVSFFIVLAIFYLFFPLDLFYATVWMLLPLGQIFQSNYYYQAMERNLANALIIIISRFSFLAVGYFFVKGADDVLLAHALIPLSYLVSGLLSAALVVKQFKSPPPYIEANVIWKMLCSGWILFFGNLAVVLYRNSNILILTAVSGNVIAISAYAVAEKLVKMLQATCTPLNQLFFPRVISALQLKNSRPVIVIWKYTKPQIVIFILFLPIVNFSAYIDFNYRQYIFNENTLPIFIIMSFAPLFGIANFMFGMVGLSAVKKSGSFARGTVLAGFSSVALCIASSQFFSAYGAAFSYLLAEVILFAYVMLVINRVG